MVYQPAHSAARTRTGRLPGPAAPLDRRKFLFLLAAGTLASLTAYVESTASAGTDGAYPQAGGQAALGPGAGAPIPATHPTHPIVSAPPSVHRVPKVAPGTLVQQLPGDLGRVAWTVDDGTSSEVLGAYLEFLKASGVRLTFFPNGFRPSWTEHAATLRPMVESGQVQLGNHTWSHPDLRELSDHDISDEIERNDSFLKNTFGVSARPFLRPPFGFHNDRVDRIAADLGYPAITMWYGSLGDSSVLSPAQVLANARQWMTAERIVIGHANHTGVTTVLGQIYEMIQERKLHTVTLSDVFSS